MDENRFDGIAKALGAPTPRRGVLGLLAALGLGRVLLGAETLEARKKNKPKKKKKKKPQSSPCAIGSKPDCAQSRCAVAVCDGELREWSCRNVCAGTSRPKCLGGRCVEDCDGSGLTECGELCCNDLVHSECCDGACCDLDQRCDDGLCVKRCDGWSDIPGGRLEYTITFSARLDEIRGNYHTREQVDQTATASAELACSYDAVWGLLDCENLGGTITGSHALHRETVHATDSSPIVTQDEQGSGSKDLPAGLYPDVGPHLEIRLPTRDADPDTYEVDLVTIAVEGTWQESPGQSGTATYWIPGLDDNGFWHSDRQPLPALPQPLSGTIEAEVPSWLGQNIARYTWTFTPDGC